MFQFEVQDMTCGHCERAITTAVKSVAPEATVTVDLSTHAVHVHGATDGGAIEEAIRQAGYSPQRKS